ncbi:MAG: hypothetical protein C4526_08380 [Nitrospiraceae bacterium]|nr:MAG: hypothetical protein C4526_08380 [Nitrospiraceae bacterium]
MTLAEYFHGKLYKNLFEKTWPLWLGGILVAFLNILMFLFLMPLGGIYPAIADWGIWMYRLAGLNITPPWGTLTPPHLSIISILNFGLIFGTLISALLSRQFKLRKDSTSGYIQGFAGGALMGLGSFLVGACIFGGFYSSIMSLSLSGLYMMTGLLAGAYFGGKFMIWQAFREAEKMEFTELVDLKTVPEKKITRVVNYPLIGLVVAITMFIIASVYFVTGKYVLGGILLFGAAFGIVFQRSSFCISAGFREVFTTKHNEPMRNLLLSLMIGTVGFAIIKANGFRPADMFILPAGMHSIIGGALFGFGMVMTGG